MQRAVNWFAFVFLRLGETLVRSLPPETALRLAEGLGRAWYACDRRRRRRAAENLRVAFGAERTPGSRRRLIRRVFVHLARTPLEQLLVARLLATPRQIARRVRFHGDIDALRARIAAGEAGLAVEGHLGSWEVGAHVVASLGAPCAVVVRPIQNPHIDRMVRRQRGAYGTIIEREGAAAGAMRALARGVWTIFAADQNAGQKGVFVPFFGVPASTHRTPAWIASRRGAPLFMFACLRRPGSGARFDLYVSELEPAAGRDPESVRTLVAACMARLEAWIRIAPDQYNWVHRRFKDRPPGEAPSAALPQYDHHRAPPGSRSPSGAPSG